MRRFAITAPVALAAVLASAAWLGAGRPERAVAAQQGATPGQLTIVSKTGAPTGVCPLKHTDVRADVAGPVARVTVTQEFHNPSREPIEAVYTFPLPQDAAVDDMTMTIGKRVVRGRILRREEAREVYEAARAAGKAAALLDQERPNVFTQAVANIMPGDAIRITISYVQLVTYAEGRYEFTFPMVVGPRFTPGGGYRKPGERGQPSPRATVDGDPGATSVVTDADRITPPIAPKGTRAGHTIGLTVNLNAGVPLGEVRAALHEVDIRREGATRAVVTLRRRDEIPNKDFVLRYTVAGAQMQEGLLTHAPRGPGAVIRTGGYFTLVVQPPADPPRSMVTPKEVVFVIDQTGSQAGWPIAKAKETMRHCIRNLNPGDTFQLIGFNTEVYPCFEKPVPATPETIARALKWLEPIEGSGGTDILKSVDYALRIPDDPARLRIICYMTDGFVGNDMQIIDYIGKHRGRARMFPLGMGNSVNRFLIEGMARAGMGAPDYVLLNEPGEAAAVRFHQRIAHPLLKDIEVDWGGLPVEDVLPRHIPDVFSSGPVVLKGRYTAPAEGQITIRGMLRGRPWSRTIRVALPAHRPDGSAIAALWARERIEELQSQDWIGAQTGKPNLEVKEAIVQTALDYRLMSQYTAFVAVEERVVNVGGKQRRIDVPVEMPEGVSYEGIFGAENKIMRSRVLFAPARPMGGMAGLGRGGFGGALGGPPNRSGGYGPPAALGQRVERGSGPEERDAASGELSAAEVEQMAPEQRRQVLQAAKLAAPLRGLAERVRKEGAGGSLRKPGLPVVSDGRVEVQVWVRDMPPDAMAKLRATGFILAAELRKGVLLFGTADVEKLDALIALGFVRRVELPKLR